MIGWPKPRMIATTTLSASPMSVAIFGVMPNFAKKDPTWSI